MKKIDLSIVIVTYNSQDTIINCIKSIFGTVRDNNYEILISDNSPNNATEETVQPLLDKHSEIYFQHNKDNLGFSKGNNAVINKSQGEYILFLNPDTKMYKDTIDGMLEFMRNNPDCGASTCFMELLNGKLDDASHRGFPTPWRSFAYFSSLSKIFPKSKLLAGYNMTYLDLNSTHEIDALAGSFMLVPFKVGKELGWWDEDFFFYGEDIDFCYRIKEAGYKIYFVPKFHALHIKGVSSGIKKVSKGITKASKETKKIITYHRFKAMEIFYDKHYKSKYPGILNALVVSGIRLRSWITQATL